VTRRTRMVRLEDLVGRRVRTESGQVIGRIQEVRAERRGDAYEVTEYHLGPGALLERLAVTQRFSGRSVPMLIARWDQLDIHRPERPTLTCPVDELKRQTR